MVLADGGLVCIDEFDKMGHEDRVAIHEVMEQQTVTISKAGIQASLNARCSILAAANPLYGTFDEGVDMRNQIAFPDSLLSRFDLIYIVRDSQSALEDRRICRQVLKQLRDRGGKDGFEGSLPALGDAQKSTTGFIVQPAVRKQGNENNAAADLNSKLRSKTASISPELLRKYVYYCKRHRAAPRLSSEAIASTAEFYSELRQRFANTTGGKAGQKFSIPTARTLEACIRLATAHARMKLRTEVLREDVRVAERLLLYTLCGEQTVHDDDDAASDSDDSESSGDESGTARGGTRRSQRQLASGTPKAPRKRTRKAGGENAAVSPSGRLSESLAEMRITPSAKKARKKDRTPRATPPGTPLDTNNERHRRIAAAVSTIRQRSGDDHITVDELNIKVREELSPDVTAEEVDRVLEGLASQNRVMLAEGVVWYI
eukprot:Polyplicarium_translucidae@DN960_c0_g1_i1.p1